MSEEPMSEGPMSEGPMSEGPMSEGPMSEEPMSEESGAREQPGVDGLEQTVHEVVLRIAGQRRRELTSVGNAQRLTADLGLGSLDLARLVAVLEIRLGVDPFAAEVNLGDMRTVGDLCLAYGRARS